MLCSLVMLGEAVAVAFAAGGGVEMAGGASNEIRVLSAQVNDLVDALAEARSEVDGLRKRQVGREFSRYAWIGMKPGQLEMGESLPPRISNVNGELRLVILDKGARQGIRPGRKFAVLRADKVIAEIETVDVREKITGAVIVRVEAGVLPETSDRLLEIAVLTK
ncbi:MAG: hypothetical protein WCN95_00130 [bacterium]